MREVFFKELFKLAKKDPDIMLLSADIGATCHDDFREQLKNQYVNTGVAEQNMIGVSSGLALAEKKVYVYSIVPFVTARCYEQIRVDLCSMKLPVVIVSIGAGLDYSTLGFTHHGTEDMAIMRVLPAMDIYSISDNVMARKIVRETYKIRRPAYIRLTRKGIPLIYKRKKDIDFNKGFSLLEKGTEMYIISTGRMVPPALKIAESLPLDCGVIDLFKIKPLNREGLRAVIEKAEYVVTLEEHFVRGGLGDLISSLIADMKYIPRLKSIGVKGEFCRASGSRDYLRKICSLDNESVSSEILKWVDNTINA